MGETAGWITPVVRNVVYLLDWPSDKIIGYRSGSGTETEKASKNAWRVDTFVATCIFLELVCFYAVMLGKCEASRDAAVVFCGWRVANIIATAARMTLFKLEPNAAVASHVRVVVLGLINYIELCVCFAVFYAADWRHIHLPPGDKPDWFSPLYFSSATQLTIGYGDLYPTGPARALAVAQAFAGVLLIVLLVSRFISVMKPIRSVSEGAEQKPPLDRDRS